MTQIGDLTIKCELEHVFKIPGQNRLIDAINRLLLSESEVPRYLALRVILSTGALEEILRFVLNETQRLTIFSQTVIETVQYMVKRDGSRIDTPCSIFALLDDIEILNVLIEKRYALKDLDLKPYECHEVLASFAHSSGCGDEG